MRTTLRLLITAARGAVTVTRWLFIASRLTARATAAAAIVAEDVATHAISYHAERRAELAAARPQEATAPTAARTQPAPAAGDASA